MKKENRRTKKHQIYTIIILTIFTLSFIMLYYDIKTMFIDKKHDEITRVVVNVEKIGNQEEINKNYIETLKETYNNDELVATIKIPNSNLNEAVFQAEDNDYYLNHNGNRQKDGWGATFMDYRIDLNNSKKILIFGHSSSKKTTPFGELEKYYDEEYYKNHKYIELTTEENTRIYEIFSVYVEVNDWSYMNLNFENEDLWYSHLLKLKSNSIYNIDTSIDSKDEIMILQTCSTNTKYKDFTKKYLLVISKRIK